MFAKVMLHPKYKQVDKTARVMRQLTLYDEHYSDWSAWSPCNRHCVTRRMRTCQEPEVCRKRKQRQIKLCPCDVTRLLRHKQERHKEEPRLLRHTKEERRLLRHENDRRLRGRRGGWNRRRKQEQQQMLEELVYDLLYNPWSEWSSCTRSCKTRRYRTCSMREWCRDTVLMEDRNCYVAGSRCQPRNNKVTVEETTEGGQQEQNVTGWLI